MTARWRARSVRRRAAYTAVLGLALLLAPAARRLEGAPASGAGEIVLTLAVDEPAWVIGAPKRFVATLRNQGAAPWRLDRFGELNALYEGKRATTLVPSCWILARADGTALTMVRKGRYVLERDQFVLLPPGGALTQELTLAAPDAPPGRLEVRLAYMPRAASPAFSVPDNWEAQQGLQGPMWLGMAYSNTLTVELVAPAGS